MTLAEFVSHLAGDGRVRVPRDVLAADDPAPLHGALLRLDALARDELPGTPPALDLEAAGHAARVLAGACAGLAHRDLGAEELAARMRRPCPSPPGPSACYSADLTLRYLPDLAALCRGVAPNDPLLEELSALARRWPLSSVGMGDLGPLDIGAFAGDACLLRLYVDRILACGDRARLSEPVVLEAARAAVGEHAALAGQLAAVLAVSDAEEVRRGRD